jgi:hypothetical protein
MNIIKNNIGYHCPEFKITFLLIVLIVFSPFYNLYSRTKSQSDKVFESRTGRDSQGYQGNANKLDFSMRPAISKNSGAGVVVGDSANKNTTRNNSEINSNDWEKIKTSKDQLDKKRQKEQAKLNQGNLSTDEQRQMKEKYLKDKADADKEWVESNSKIKNDKTENDTEMKDDAGHQVAQERVEEDDATAKTDGNNKKITVEN